MAQWVCKVCGYVHEGESAPETCPICKAGPEKFTQKASAPAAEAPAPAATALNAAAPAAVVEKAPAVSRDAGEWACEHIVGLAKGAPEDIMQELRANFTGECSEVGMYLAMSRVAFREGYPEIGLYWEKAAFEEAEHAAKFAELLGDVVTPSTKQNLTMRVEAENGATAGKKELAERAEEAGYPDIRDTVMEMAKDEARHGRALKGLLERYFG